MEKFSNLLIFGLIFGSFWGFWGQAKKSKASTNTYRIKLILSQIFLWVKLFNMYINLEHGKF